MRGGGGRAASRSAPLCSARRGRSEHRPHPALTLASRRLRGRRLRRALGGGARAGRGTVGGGGAPRAGRGAVGRPRRAGVGRRDGRGGRERAAAGRPRRRDAPRELRLGPAPTSAAGGSGRRTWWGARRGGLHPLLSPPRCRRAPVVAPRNVAANSRVGSGAGGGGGHPCRCHGGDSFPFRARARSLEVLPLVGSRRLVLEPLAARPGPADPRRDLGKRLPPPCGAVRAAVLRSRPRRATPAAGKGPELTGCRDVEALR